MMHGGGWWSMVRDGPQGKTEVNRKTLRRVIGYGRPYAGWIALMLAAILVTSVIELLPPLFARDLIDHAIPDRDMARLSLLALGMIAVPLFSALIGTLQRWISARVGEGIIYDLRRQMFDHLQRMALRFYTLSKTGELMSRFTTDVVGAQNAVTGTLVSVVTNLITLASTLVVMLTIEWRLTLAALLVLPLLYIPARKVASTLRDLSRKALELNGRMNGQLNETLNISGALLVKVFGRQEKEKAAFKATAAGIRDIGVRRAVVARWFFVAAGLVSSIGAAVLFWTGGYLVIAGALSVGTIVAFISYLGRLYQPLVGLSSIQVDLAQSLVSFERVFEYLDMPVEIEDRPGAIHLSRVKGAVAFDHVKFTYQSSVQYTTTPGGNGMGMGGPGFDGPGLGRGGMRGMRHALAYDPREAAPAGADATRQQGRVWALDDVTFEVRPGQLVALVGPSGAGKTTLSYLLPRLYEPQEGRILLDGHPLSDLTLATLAEHIGLVTQETYLFHDTVRANLLYARPDASQEQLDAACRAAYIDEVIQRMPQRYDTVVGERGYRLSGGEKQRVALARIILKNPSVLLLDEATSSLDSQSEAYIQQALDTMFVGRTSIVIAHRLSTILAADLILVLDGGRVVEQGNHQQLVNAGGLYATLYETQFRSLLAEDNAPLTPTPG